MSSIGWSTLASRPRVRAVGLCLLLGLFGWLSGMAAAIGMDGYLTLFGYDTQTISDIGLSVAFNVVGAAGVAITYLIIRRNGFDRAFVADFLRLRTPNRRDVGWILVGFLGAFVVLIGYQMLVDFFDPFGTNGEGTTHSGIEAGRQYPILFLVGIPLALLLTGPGEELLYRGVIQSRLGETFSTGSAVLLAGLVFGAVHFPAYMGEDFGAVLVSIGTVTVLGLYFGVLYELSDSLVVPALVHGCYNAFIYLMNYVTYA